MGRTFAQRGVRDAARKRRVIDAEYCGPCGAEACRQVATRGQPLGTVVETVARYGSGDSGSVR
eukprot:5100501-Pyramimonas_sp.AAC.1